MLINDIITETTSGGIAIVAQPIGKVIKRPNPSVFSKSKKTKKTEEAMDEVKYVDGFIGADGKPTSKPTAKDYASNKEFQDIKKKLGDRMPKPTKRDKNGKLSPFKKDEHESS